MGRTSHRDGSSRRRLIIVTVVDLPRRLSTVVDLPRYGAESGRSANLSPACRGGRAATVYPLAQMMVDPPPDSTAATGRLAPGSRIVVTPSTSRDHYRPGTGESWTYRPIGRVSIGK
jgi:hypothetical protein